MSVFTERLLCHCVVSNVTSVTMSQKVSRKSAVTEDKDKRNTNSPVKEMKKKMAANAEKEKQAAEKEKVTEKPAEKATEKQDKPEKPEKPEKQEKAEKSSDKKSDKKEQAEKKSEKAEPQPEKSSKEETSKEDKSAKSEKEKPEAKKPEPSKQKQNGRDRVHNGVSDVTLGNGTDDVLNGTPKDSKVLKLKDDAPPTDRKLRSADSPKPADKVTEKKESKKEGEESKDVVGDKEESKSQEEKDMDVVEVEPNDGSEPQRKTDTNFSKSRVKVSPYRRSMRLADQTNTSLVANYTGNNTTMEMDITESSSIMEEPALDDSSYLRGLRSIRGRSSYKPLKEITLRHVVNRSTTSVNTSASTPIAENSRPTGTVVGRKRKPEHDDSIELATEAHPEPLTTGAVPVAGGSKRLRVLERLAEPFRRVASAASVSLPSAHRRNAEIVGINTDLPLTAPVVAAESFDPETLKATPLPAPDAPVAVPLPPAPARDLPDNKRCVVM
ncbi:uncharacterized protein LOC142983455 isoform X5 [Anticarsia gemmatalis]|uniref:uncharacterized protein LOC142983455 isoform X5 n=1 Tax=Anticarsia gemmatalis TaxID=129554 RepID=UPI003F77065F